MSGIPAKSVSVQEISKAIKPASALPSDLPGHRFDNRVHNHFEAVGDFENYRLRVLGHCAWQGVINRI